MEGDPVNSSIVAFQHELDDCISVPKHIRLASIRPRHLIFEGHGGRGGVFLPKTGDIPNANGLVKRCGDDQVFLRVELRAHHVVVVTGHRAD